MKAKSIKGRSPEEIQTKLDEAMADGFQPTLATVFISIKQDIEAVREIMDKKSINIFGMTSCGEFIDGEISEGAIAILLLDMKKTDFRILIETYEGKEPGEVAGAMGLSALEYFKNPAFLISNSVIIPAFIDGVSVINGLENAIGSDLTIWGGNAGDDRQFDHTIVFTNDRSFQRGIMLLVIDADKIIVKGCAAYGWKPAGIEKTITKCDKDFIYTIDDEPAVDTVLKFLGLKLTKEEAEKFKPDNVVFCLAREKGAPVMRTSLFFNWDERSIYAGNIVQGTKFRFALPPDFEIVESVTKEAQLIKDNEIPDADALVMFSCIGRQDELGPMVSMEIEGIKDSFNVPMAGFFTYGEFGRATGGKNEYHNTTCCWVALKEK